MLRVLSLGAGVQSSTLLLMAAEGELEHVPDAAIFADTGWEPRAVYEWLGWLEEQVRGVIPIYRVRRAGPSIRDGYAKAGRQGKRYVQLPVFVKNPDGSAGMGLRQCTQDYKIEPIIAQVRELLGMRPRSRVAPIVDATGGVRLWRGKPWEGPTQEIVSRKTRRNVTYPVLAEQWLGISTDEVVRMKPSRVGFIRNSWPLIERSISRDDCLAWWSTRGLPAPPKSACIGCPYTDDSRWQEMRANAPEEWEDAVAFDREIRHGADTGVRLRGENFLHSSLIPLDQVEFGRDYRLQRAELAGQGSLLGGWADRRADEERAFHDECEGMCGV